ncbi:alpha/beta hydrolase [Oleiagrimonas sp.]|jgi:pimeloyl-ACP methyl ester carboxylesterase|uniref:alpha/beta hydrolase n=1 Tax=Oleiagrimonas sp. TaxID=2010330 RepID=UPI0026025C08|nr:alpha/beta hydrolase [Oleiagrimonas sp.]MDA3914252.1 alpha/beta hydrolase [Oleiagrimonas sp.]
METFVLVHGAWGGSFGFRHVRRRLQKAGHEVFTPSLTGIGERVHLASPQITLSTHIQDVVNQILYEDLSEIVLLGYSYGGAVVTGSLEHVADRVSHLVYLDAFVPSDGDSVLSLVGMPRSPLQIGSQHFLPPTPREFDDPSEGQFQNLRRVPQPMATALEPVRLSQPLESFGFRRTYIRATQGDPSEIGNAHFATAAARARESEAWSFHEIETNHMILSNRPDELANLLLEIA